MRHSGRIGRIQRVQIETDIDRPVKGQDLSFTPIFHLDHFHAKFIRLGALMTVQCADADLDEAPSQAFFHDARERRDEIGAIEGVVRTEAGFIGGREVTLVEYASEQLALEELARRAKQAGVADLVHLEAGAARSVAGVAAGPPLDQTYRTAPASDQKKQIQGTPFAKLPLSAAQATKVNAFARQNPAKASEWLTRRSGSKSKARGSRSRG